MCKFVFICYLYFSNFRLYLFLPYTEFTTECKAEVLQLTFGINFFGI